MADIGLPTYYPSPPSLVDAVFEAQRVATQMLRSNPLENAITSKGLMQWLGHYGGFYLWIGEFFPGDPNQLNPNGSIKPQLGFSLVRDDPKEQSAIAMYDWDPLSGHPLRQKLGMGDADGRILLREGESGGWGWPRFPIQMGAAIPPAYLGTADVVALSGRSQVVGRHVDYMYDISVMAVGVMATTNGLGNVPVPLPFGGLFGSTQVSSYVEVVIGANTITTPVTHSTGFVAGTIDLGASWMPNLAADYMIVNVHVFFNIQGAAGAQNCVVVTPIYFHNVTLWTSRITDGI